ncbi:hypothetical protein TWF694_005897 [Orbilia ellipsospora]|uniref:Nicotinamide-nucleotide adenylyltransferase n=1 Tax=Orbilia ellipsospora TaxID=2528407 RepID=A0AAV9WTB2_9PEZI
MLWELWTFPGYVSRYPSDQGVSTMASTEPLYSQPTMNRIATIRRLLPTFREAVTALAESPSPKFTLIKSFPARDTSNVAPKSKRTMCILDSSYNPPTKAHMHLALKTFSTYHDSLQSNSVNSQTEDVEEGSVEILLLLATANADKQPVPASYEHRLAMMCLLAQDIRDTFTDSITPPRVNVAITPHARFIDKSADLGASEVYPQDSTQQVWILGYDTLIRLLDTKYYPPTHTLTPVYDTLLSHNNRIAVFGRLGSDYGNTGTQTQFFKTVDPRVSERLDTQDSVGDEEIATISSTSVRKGVKEDTEAWKADVCESVAGYIIEEELYR